MLSLAAREADIVSLDPIGTAAGTKDFATASLGAVEQKVDWVRAAAGARFESLELHIFVYVVNVTEDRQSAAEQIVQLFSTFPSTMFSNIPTRVEEVLDSPHFLLGTIEQIAEELQLRRERYGIYILRAAGDRLQAILRAAGDRPRTAEERSLVFLSY